MEHLKNIATGAFAVSVIGGAVWLYVWLCNTYTLPMIFITAAPFMGFALWGFGRSLRQNEPSDG